VKAPSKKLGGVGRKEERPRKDRVARVNSMSSSAKGEQLEEGKKRQKKKMLERLEAKSILGHRAIHEISILPSGPRGAEKREKDRRRRRKKSSSDP